MAVYNCGAYLPAALDSILVQTFADFEVVVVDDASTDETAAILRDYAQMDSRVVLLRNERNLKLAASLNRGMEVCRAPLVARADGDDICHPKRLQKQVEFLNQHLEVGAVSSSYTRATADGLALGFHALPTQSAMIKFKLLWESTLCHAGVLYRVGEVRAVGGYDETFVTAQDYDLWARLAERTEFANLAESLVTVRRHGACATAVHAQETSRLGCTVSARLLSRYLGRSLTENETGPLTSLLCAYDPIAECQLDPALLLLDELLRRAKAHEEARTYRWARCEVGGALLKQASYRRYCDPHNSWKLWRKASAICGLGSVSKASLFQLIRLLLRFVYFRLPETPQGK
jgi:glycosyltransferase involved in cell wall biosynthesis